MALYSAQDQGGRERRNKVIERLLAAQAAAAMLHQVAAPMAGQHATAAAAVPPTVMEGQHATGAAAVPPPQMAGQHATAAAAVPSPDPARTLPNEAGGPKAPRFVTPELLERYEKYGNPLEALARRLARKKQGIHLGGADNEEQARKASALGLLPGTRQTRVLRPRRRG